MCQTGKQWGRQLSQQEPRWGRWGNFLNVVLFNFYPPGDLDLDLAFYPPGDLAVQQCRHHSLQTPPGSLREGDWKGLGEGEKENNFLEICSMIFSPGVRCECVLSVLVHLWIFTSDAHTQHGRIFNIKVARSNHHHHHTAGSYSEHVKHGRGHRDTKSGSLLCLKGLLIVIWAFCLNILCSLCILSFNT